MLKQLSMNLGGGSGSGGVADGKNVRTTRFATISSSTSGTVTLPSNSTVILDDFGGTVDAVITTITGGRPNTTNALTAGGSVVSTTFDSSGNWVLSAAPSAYPVAIVYRVQQTLANFDDTSSNIWGEVDAFPVGGGGSGITRSIASISSATPAGSTALTDYVYFVSGTTTLTLPTAAGNANRYSVKNSGVATVTVATTSAQTIDGSSTVTLVPNQTLEFVSDNSNWGIF